MPRSVDFTGYDPFDPGVSGPLRDAARDVAERHYERLMAARPARREALAALCAIAGVAMEPAALGAWLAPELAAADAPLTGPDAWRWSGVVADVALWLGERVIAAAAGAIRWELLVAPRKATGYQRPVLVGFRRVDDPRYYVDIAHLVASWAELAARRRPVKPDFLATIEAITLADA